MRTSVVNLDKFALFLGREQQIKTEDISTAISGGSPNLGCTGARSLRIRMQVDPVYSATPTQPGQSLKRQRPGRGVLTVVSL